MINPEIQETVNQQIKQEITAAYNYLGMSAYFHHENLSGFAQWCLIQYQEELQHALKLFHYLLDREGRIKLEPIEAPKCNYDSPLEVFKTALAQEQENTRSIDALYERASALKDHATVSHLQWFVNEQVEEEASTRAVIDQLKMVDGNPNGLFMIDRELAARQFDPAAE